MGTLKCNTVPHHKCWLTSFQNQCKDQCLKNSEKTIMGWQHISDLFKWYNHPEERVETCNQKNRKGRTVRAERVVENKRKTYAEAVKRHNNTALKEVAEEPLHKNNPFCFNLLNT